jgi:hypothetical protein
MGTADWFRAPDAVHVSFADRMWNEIQINEYRLKAKAEAADPPVCRGLLRFLAV